MTANISQFAIRSNENSRRTWTLTSLAVRIAHALGLHRESSGCKYTSRHPAFEREMRRRLWWQICNLDRQGSVDRGSDPIITRTSFSTQFPLHVNDEDLIPNDPREVQPREEYTDSTFSLLCHEVFDIEHRLNYVPAGEPDRLQGNTDDYWTQRRDWVIACQQRIEDKYLRHCNMTIPLQRYNKLVADIIIATLWLHTYRPLQKHSDSPTSAITPQPGILHLSVEVMEKAYQIPLDPSAGPFRWITSTWVQWHPLAVMIAELCVQTEGPLVERAWTILNAVFEQTAQLVADSARGRLWRPIKKLMNKARMARTKYLEDVATASACLSSDRAPAATDRTVCWPENDALDSLATEINVEPKLAIDASGPVPDAQQSVPSTEPISFDWDPWVATGPSEQMDYNNEVNQMAWTNWEHFIDDFQANGELQPSEEGMTPPSFKMW